MRLANILLKLAMCLVIGIAVLGAFGFWSKRPIVVIEKPRNEPVSRIIVGDGRGNERVAWQK